MFQWAAGSARQRGRQRKGRPARPAGGGAAAAGQQAAQRCSGPTAAAKLQAAQAARTRVHNQQRAVGEAQRRRQLVRKVDVACRKSR